MEAHSSQSPGSQLAWQNQYSRRSPRATVASPHLSTANATITMSFSSGREQQDKACSTKDAVAWLLLASRLAYLSFGREQKSLQLRFTDATCRFDEGNPFAAALAALGKVQEGVFDFEQMQLDHAGNAIAVGKLFYIGKIAESLLLHLSAHAGFLKRLDSRNLMRFLALDRPTFGNNPATAFAARYNQDFRRTPLGQFSVTDSRVLLIGTAAKQRICVGSEL